MEKSLKEFEYLYILKEDKRTGDESLTEESLLGWVSDPNILRNHRIRNP